MKMKRVDEVVEKEMAVEVQNREERNQDNNNNKNR